jgi:hypothetical protein
VVAQPLRRAEELGPFWLCVAPLRLGGLRGKKSTPSVWLGGTGEFLRSRQAGAGMTFKFVVERLVRATALNFYFNRSSFFFYNRAGLGFLVRCCGFMLFLFTLP